MLADHIRLNGGEGQVLPGVFQSDLRVAGPVALVGGVAVLGVVEEIVVEQRPPDQIPFVTVDAKFFKKFFQL